MQELERLVQEGNYNQVLQSTAAWTDKQKREAAKWLAEQAKKPLSSFIATCEQDGGAQWMSLLVAQAACATDVKKAFAIPPPRWPAYVDSWDEYDFARKVPADSMVALIQAVARRGRDWVQAWVETAAGGKRKRPMFSEALTALTLGFGLDFPADGYLGRVWGASLYRVCQVPRGLPADGIAKPYDMTVVGLGVARGADGGIQVEGRDVRGNSPLDCARALYGARPAMAALLSRRDDVLAIAGRYGDASDLDSVTQVVAGLVAGGELDRAEMTAGTIAALTRGDSVSAQRLQVRLLLAADPGPDILEPHAQTLASLLASGHGSAAEAAQTLLARLDAAQPLDAGLFIDSCRMVFARKEKGLRRDQLAWAARRLKDHASRLAATVQGMMEALAVDDYALQKEAAAKIAAAWPRVQAEQRSALLAQAESSQGALDGKLYQELMAALGASPDSSAAAAAAPLAPPAARTPPVRTPQALVTFQRLRGLAQDPSPFLAAQSELSTGPGVNAIEQLLEFAVQAANAGRGPLAERLVAGLYAMSEASYAELLAEQGRNPPPRHPNLGHHNRTQPAAATVARMREYEVIQAIRKGDKYALLSTPSYTNGAIDPGELASRLFMMAGQGTRSGPVDLLLALMRTLPATAQQLADLRALGTPESVIAADFLEAGGMSQMTTEWLVTQPDPGERHLHGNANWIARTQREVCVSLHGMKVLPAIADIPVHWSLGFTPATAPDVWEFDIQPRYLGAVMPNNAEVLAALHLWGFRKGCHDDTTEGGKATIRALPHFLEAGGPAGPALHLAVLYSLSGNAPESRITGSDGLVTLLGQGRFNEALACELLAATVTHGSVKCGRLAASLARVADAGEELAVWPLARAALTAALALEAPPAGLADLVALASRLAPLLDVREAIPALGSLASGKGSGKLVTEARRLHGLLSA